jgi:hypothetical protein
MRAQVYWNLHLKCWSLRDPRTGRVFAHAAHVELVDAVCRVQRGARERMVRERRRSVHAYVVGEVRVFGAAAPERAEADAWVRFTYNPYRSAQFHVADPTSPTPLAGAARMRFDPEGAWCAGMQVAPPEQ